MKRRMPAEWEEQEAILLGWPHEKSDWLPQLDIVEPVFIEIAKAISRFERVIIAAPNACAVEGKLRSAKLEMERIDIYEMDTNDTWARDFGPIAVFENERPILLDFGFNGWGLKYPANFDNLISRKLHKAGAFGRTEMKTVGMILEGGSIESDGNGAILATSRCLLDPNRNPHLTREGIEEALSPLLGANRFLWLEKGALVGDDTDSHIDTLARFAPDDTILHVSCDDPDDEQFEPIGAMVEELKDFRTKTDERYRLLALPQPAPCFDEQGDRLPATYANFLIVNQVVLVPTYRDKNDATALSSIGKAFPNREIIGIDCLPLVLQHGSLHCITMQIPKGALE